MKIDYFKKHFVDYLEECSCCSTIELDSIDSFQNRIVYDYEKVGNKIILLTSENKRPHIPHLFYISIFNNIEDVVFLVNNKEISDFTLKDVSWSDRIFTFEGDF